MLVLLMLASLAYGKEGTIVSRLRSPDYAVQAQAAFDLGISAGPGERATALPLLRRALKSSELYVRYQAAWALGRSGSKDRETVSALLGAAGSADWYLQSRAADALGEVGADDPRTTLALTGLLRHPRPAVRRSAAYSLGKLSPPTKGSIDALFSSADDVDPTVRVAAFWSLRTLYDGEAPPDVPPSRLEEKARASWDDPDGRVRSAAFGILARVHPEPPGLAGRVEQALLGEDREAALGAIYAVSRLAGAAAKERNLAQSRTYLDLLIRGLDTPQGPIAVQSLADLGERLETSSHTAIAELAAATVIRALRSADSELSYYAIHGLSRFKGAARRAVPALAQIVMDDPQERSREAAARLLGELGPAASDAAPALLAAIERKKAWPGDVPLAAAGALARMGRRDPRLAKLLAGGLDATNSYTREWSIVSLGQLPDDDLSGLGHKLAERLQDSEPKIRAHAAWLLSRSTTAANGRLPELVRALSDPDPYVRHRSLATLSYMKQAAVRLTPPFAKALSDADHEVRATAAWGLGVLGRAPRELHAAVKDRHQSVRFYAAVAEACMGLPVGGLKRLIDDGPASGEPADDERRRGLGCLAQREAAEIKAAIRGLRHPDPKWRRHYVCSLGKKGPAARLAVPALEQALKDRDPGVSHDSAAALACIAKRSDLAGSLRAGLASSDAGTRFTAAAGLACLKEAKP